MVLIITSCVVVGGTLGDPPNNANNANNANDADETTRTRRRGRDDADETTRTVPVRGLGCANCHTAGGSASPALEGGPEDVFASLIAGGVINTANPDASLLLSNRSMSFPRIIRTRPFSKGQIPTTCRFASGSPMAPRPNRRPCAAAVSSNRNPAFAQQAKTSLRFSRREVLGSTR